jgi:hypothetical protein
MQNNDSNKVPKTIENHLPHIVKTGVKSLANDWDTKILEAKSISKEEHVSVLFNIFGTNDYSNFW